jgi:hypothetical protein
VRVEVEREEDHAWILALPADGLLCLCTFVHQ